jgi:hypothetical protein
MSEESSNNFRTSKSCYCCFHNRNRLDRKKTEHIECEIYRISEAFISLDWVCDDHVDVNATKGDKP